MKIRHIWQRDILLGFVRLIAGAYPVWRDAPSPRQKIYFSNHTSHIDTLARWGGEEFAVLLPQTDLEAAHLVAGRICRSLAQNVFERVGCVTASFGVAMYQTGESASALLGRADDALYRAKRNGRNRVE